MLKGEKKIQLLLREIELKEDIEIIYAAECGWREWSLTRTSLTELCIVFIRNDKSTYGVTSRPGYFFGTKGIFEWNAFDISSMANWALQRMYPFAVETLFANTVHKSLAHKYSFVEETRRALLHEPRVSMLVQHYVANVRYTWQSMVDTCRKNGDTRVDVDSYVSLVREVATIQWLNHTHIIDINNTTSSNRSSSTKLIETNLTRVLDDLKAVHSEEEPGLHKCLLDFVSTVRQKKQADQIRMERVPQIERWIVRTIKASGDLIRGAESNEAKMLELVRIAQENMSLKFGRN